MIDKKLVEKLVLDKISDTEYFIVEISVSNDNTISVEIDKDNGVDIDFCVGLSKHIEGNIDREIEDYSLEVGSAGLTSPFKVLRQYEKNIGNDVEVLLLTGIKYKGLLVEVDEEKFTVEVTKMLRKEGDKRKKEYTENFTFKYEEIKTTKYIF